MVDSDGAIPPRLEVAVDSVAPIVELPRPISTPSRSRLSGRLLQWLAGWPGRLLFGLLSGLVLLLAFQFQPFSQTVDVGPGSDSTYLAQFYAPETNQDFDYRWSRAESYLNLYQTGTPYQVSFRALTAHPTLERVEVRLIANGQEIGRVQVGRSPEIFTVRSSRPIWGPEDLSLTLRVSSTFAEAGAGGRGKLGIAVDWVRVEPYRNRLGLIIPPPFQWLWWLGVVMWFFGANRLLRLGLKGWQVYLPPALTLGLVVGLLVAPATARPMHTDWVLVGLQIGLVELSLIGGWLVITSCRQKHLPRTNLPRATLLLLLVGLACLYLASAKGRLSYGDDQIMQGATAAIVAGRPTAPLTDFLPGPNQPFYSKYGIGLSLVGIPFYLLGNAAADLFPFMLSQRNGTAGLSVYILLLTDLLLTVASVYLFYWWLRLVGAGQWAALVTTALYGVGTMTWHYARTFMSEPLVVFCLLFALVSCLKYRQTGSWRWAAWGGFIVGLSIATRLPNLACIPFFGLYLLWAWWERADRLKAGLSIARLKSLLLPAFVWSLGIIFWLTIVGWYNYTRNGALLDSGYGGETFDTPFLTGFWGLFFSSGKSLFIYNPVLLLGLVGLVAAFRRQRAVTLLVLAIVGYHVLTYSVWSIWWGGGVWGPRYLLPIVPFLLWPAVYLFGFLDKPRDQTQPTNPAGRTVLKLAFIIIAVAIVLASLLMQFLSIVIDYQIYAAIYGHQPDIFQKALYNPADSPVVVHWNLWWEQTRPDLAFRFYHETPFARWVALVQQSAWLLFWGCGLLALAVWLRPKKGQL